MGVSTNEDTKLGTRWHITSLSVPLTLAKVIVYIVLHRQADLLMDVRSLHRLGIGSPNCLACTDYQGTIVKID